MRGQLARICLFSGLTPSREAGRQGWDGRGGLGAAYLLGDRLLPPSLLGAPDLTLRPLTREGCRARTPRVQHEQTSWSSDVQGSEAFTEEDEPWLLLVFASRALVPSLTERGLQWLLSVSCARLFHSGIRHSLCARTSSLVEGGNLRFFWDVLLPSVISQHMLS